jgi:hypothetical protein
MEEISVSDYMDGLYAYAMVLSRNPEEASDLVQETYFRALKAKERLRPGSNLLVVRVVHYPSKHLAQPIKARTWRAKNRRP